MGISEHGPISIALPFKVKAIHVLAGVKSAAVRRWGDEQVADINREGSGGIRHE
jgi:hypothetical protein